MGDNIRARCMRPANYKWTPDAEASPSEAELRQQIADLQKQLDCSRKVTKTFAEEKFQAQNAATVRYQKALDHLNIQRKEVQQLKDLLEGARKHVADLGQQLATLRELPENERLMELVQLELTVFQSRILREVQENREVMNKHFANANQMGRATNC